MHTKQTPIPIPLTQAAVHIQEPFTLTAPGDRARAAMDHLDHTTMADIRAMSGTDLDRLESLLWHWASLAESERMARRKAQREEESE